MIEQIGKVKLDYTFYKGKDCYSDGDEIENSLLDIVKNKEEEIALQNNTRWPILYHLSDIRENIIDWYPFKKDSEVLEIGSGCGAISGILCRKAKHVTCIELSKRRSEINANRNKDFNNLDIIVGNFQDIKLEKKFDYITLIGVLEYAALYIDDESPYKKMLLKIRKLLKPNGKIIIAIENKMGLKYLNGAKEDHVGYRFAGIEDYRFYKNVRTFSKPELLNLLIECNLDKTTFYYPIQDYKLPDTIYSDRYLPKAGSIRTWGMNYSETRIALYNDAIMADQICRDQMFHYFSNSFLVVVNDDNNEVDFAHYRKACKKEYQTRTILNNLDGKRKICKEYLHEVSREYDILFGMAKWYRILQEEYKNVCYLPLQINEEGTAIQYDFIDGISLEEELGQYVYDIDKLIKKFRAIIKKYYKYEEGREIDFVVTDKYREIFGNNYIQTEEKSLIVTNIDMILQNLIKERGKVYCIDYEWCFDFPIPNEFLLYRTISSFYRKYNMYFLKEISRNQLLVKLGIKKTNISIYDNMENAFQEYIYGKNRETYYLKNYVKPCGMIELKGI